MEWAKLVLEYVQALVWPLVVAGLSVAMRRQLVTLVGNLAERFRDVESASAAGVELRFAQQAGAAERALTIANRSVDGDEQERSDQARSSLSVFLGMAAPDLEQRAQELESERCEELAHEDPPVQDQRTRRWRALRHPSGRWRLREAYDAMSELPFSWIEPPDMRRLFSGDLSDLPRRALGGLMRYLENVRLLYKLPEGDDLPRLLRMMGDDPLGDPGYHAVAESLRIIQGMYREQKDQPWTDDEVLRFLELVQEAVDTIGRLTQPIIDAALELYGPQLDSQARC